MAETRGRILLLTRFHWLISAWKVVWYRVKFLPIESDNSRSIGVPRWCMLILWQMERLHKFGCLCHGSMHGKSRCWCQSSQSQDLHLQVVDLCWRKLFLLALRCQFVCFFVPWVISCNLLGTDFKQVLPLWQWYFWWSLEASNTNLQVWFSWWCYQDMCANIGCL